MAEAGGGTTATIATGTVEGHAIAMAIELGRQTAGDHAAGTQIAGRRVVTIPGTTVVIVATLLTHVPGAKHPMQGKHRLQRMASLLVSR